MSGLTVERLAELRQIAEAALAVERLPLEQRSRPENMWRLVKYSRSWTPETALVVLDEIGGLIEESWRGQMGTEYFAAETERLEAEVERLRSELEAALAHGARLREVLEDYQWGSEGCPGCGNFESEGHAPGCRVVSTLGEKGNYTTRFVLYNDDLNVWKCQADDCRAQWQFEIDTPYEHHWRFCPRCGRRIERGDAGGQNDAPRGDQ